MPPGIWYISFTFDLYAFHHTDTLSLVLHVHPLPYTDRCPSPPRTAVAMLEYRRALAMPKPGGLPQVLPQSLVHTHSGKCSDLKAKKKKLAQDKLGIYSPSPGGIQPGYMELEIAAAAARAKHCQTLQGRVLSGYHSWCLQNRHLDPCINKLD